MGGSVKISPLKNLKTAVQVKTEKVGEKENIPERLKRPPEAMLSSSVTIIKKEVKEEVDQVSSHASPAKVLFFKIFFLSDVLCVCEALK